MCGDCDRCLRACPTGALVAAYSLDPRRCVSRNVHIKPRESFPVPLEGTLDDPDLIPLLDAGEEAYRAAFGGFALAAGLETLRRNAILALANTPDPAAVPHLARLADSRRGGVRTMLYVAWALGRIGTEDAIRTLTSWLEREPSPAVRREIAAALHRAAQERPGKPSRLRQS